MLLKQRLPPLSLLLAALLMTMAPCQQASAARTLAQAPDGGPAPAPMPSAEAGQQAPVSMYGTPEVDACVTATNKAGQACTVESDTLSLIYPRGSEDPPTAGQVATAINDMKAAAQPSRTCCLELRPYSDGRCPCDAGYQQLLPSGGFSPAYFEGATSILAQSCSYAFPPCQPGETINVTALSTPVPGGG